MNETSMRWYVVVLDDRGEFALHVWRYLDRSLSIGTHPTDGSDANWLTEEDVIPFRDGVHRFCWLHADSRWEVKLRRFLDNLADGWGLLAIVDVNGKGSYDPKLVLALLDTWQQNVAIRVEKRLVSAYHIGARIEQDIEVQPKSRSTLNELGRLLYGDTRRTPYRQPAAKHILVTGAGFEIRNPRGGFGMLPTPQLLRSMKNPFVYGEPPRAPSDDLIHLVDSRGLPYPSGGRWSTYAYIQNAAEQSQLDRYWDLIFIKELTYRIGDFGVMAGLQRETTAARALLGERRMREAFRRSIRNHDWGHMNQSLAAANLPWHAWLTTNYTRFADRAIALMAAQEWRIISTGAEANLSIREDDGRLDTSYRYLFKLHGDVGHLHTMAIAGYDKDLFSPLSMPVDNLYLVYASAERLLSRSLGDGPVVWHVVGHAMGDHRLIKLMTDASSQANGNHLFLIANPDPVAPTISLKASLDSRHTCEGRRFMADEYLAPLAHSGLPTSDHQDAVVKWFHGLSPGQRDLANAFSP